MREVVFMRKLVSLLVVAGAMAALAVGPSTAFGSIAGLMGLNHALTRTQTQWDCGGNCGGNNGGGGCCSNDCSCNNDCSCDCSNDCKKHLGSPGADCTDNRMGVYSRVDNLVYICLLPKNNTPQARARSILICETPTDRGGQGGSSIDADGLAFICVGPSGPQ